MRLSSALLISLVGCSDFSSSGGGGGSGGAQVDAPEKTKDIHLVCTNNLIESLTVTPPLSWQLSVDPGAIPSGEAFGAKFRAIAAFHEGFLATAQREISGGVSRVDVVEGRATVHVRRGTVRQTPSEDDVALRVDVPWTCRYDETGEIGVDAGPFPACAPEKSNSDQSNPDCTGLGGETHPDNRCGQFVDIETSSDCSLDGPCKDRQDQCMKNEFCVTAPLEIRLVGETVRASGYNAAPSGSVLFGWDDASTGAELDQTGGPNHGAWKLLPAVWDDDPGPNSLRLYAGDNDIPVAIECTMGVYSQGPEGVGSRDPLASPTPDHALIAFPIREP